MGGGKRATIHYWLGGRSRRCIYENEKQMLHLFICLRVEWQLTGVSLPCPSGLDACTHVAAKANTARENTQVTQKMDETAMTQGTLKIYTTASSPCRCPATHATNQLCPTHAPTQPCLDPQYPLLPLLPV
jgi:hypothetical protein